MADHGRTARATLPKDGPRKSNRARKVSQAMQRVDAEEQQHAVQARLDALENDNVEEAGAFGLASDDEEYVIEGSSDEGGGTRKRKGKTKGRKNSKRHDRPKMFSALLEEADLENQIDDGPNYLTAAAGPPSSFASRKFCSVCGFTAPYTCTRCRSRFCSRKCKTVHAETRCLKFTL
mmetsp:Transcript_36510/g.103123  ORF Transcript_36510/g.103123 Transcript_36510/m.103123 type:complete len:177 (+) Transcript_36510:441-971(+)